MKLLQTGYNSRSHVFSYRARIRDFTVTRSRYVHIDTINMMKFVYECQLVLSINSEHFEHCSEHITCVEKLWSFFNIVFNNDHVGEGYPRIVFFHYFSQIN